MLYCEGNRRRRSTHACVGGLEGQGGLLSTYLHNGSYALIHGCISACTCTPIPLAGIYVPGYITRGIITKEVPMVVWVGWKARVTAQFI